MSWVLEIIQLLTIWIPRLLIVEETHAGVKFCRGKVVKIMNPGLHVWWPLVTKVQVYPTKRQSCNPSSQYLTTLDLKTVALQAMVVYDIVDVVKFLTYTFDGEDTIADYALTAISSVIRKTTFKQLMNKDLNLKDRLAEDLEEYGVRIVKAELSHFAETIVITWVTE